MRRASRLALRTQPATTRTKCPARWQWPASLPPAYRGLRFRSGRNGVRLLLSSRSSWLLAIGFPRHRVTSRALVTTDLQRTPLPFFFPSDLPPTKHLTLLLT